jgi:molecular chaperone GrpE
MNKPDDLDQTTEQKQEEKQEHENPDLLNLGYIVELQNKNTELEERIKKLEEDIIRAGADSDNLRKRYEKQLSDTREYSISAFVKDLLNVIDNMSRAMNYLPDVIEESIKNTILGIEMTQKELESVLAKHGVSVINPEIGSAFDHNLHQAISQIDSDEYSVGSIINVMQLGYVLKGRLLRAASVIVAK